MPPRLRALLVLGRVSNLPTVWSNLAVAWLLAVGPLVPDVRFVWLLLGGTLLYLGGTTLNDVFDAAFDRQFRAERPIPQGTLRRATVGLCGFGYLAVGSLAWFLAGVAWPWLLSLLASILLYDWLHKRWAGSVFLMGACRFFLVVGGASVHGMIPPWLVWLHATCLFAYIVGLTFIARGESRPDQLRHWPLGLLFFPLMVPLLSTQSPGKLACSVMLSGAAGYCLRRALAHLRQRQDPARIGHFVAKLLAMIVLLDWAVIVTLSPIWALPVFGLYALALFWQRRIPAT